MPRLGWALGAVLAAPAALLAAAALAWTVLSQVDFFYARLYDALAIDRHIAEFAPQNRYRDGFGETSRAERVALFRGMLAAVNDGGRGLDALAYTHDDREVALLRPAEIAHLRYVAGLVSVLKGAGMAGGAWLAVYLVALRRTRRRPPLGVIAAGTAVCLAVPALLALAAFDGHRGGWFDRLHAWAFPADHQWFFYYQESLMTTLLKAPDLFGPMGAQWLGLTALVFLALIAALYGTTRHHAR